MSSVSQRPQYGSVSSSDHISASWLRPSRQEQNSSLDATDRGRAVVAAYRPDENIAIERVSGALSDLRPFGHKMRVYLGEATNAHYGVANAAVLSGMAGLGIANGGYMVLLRGLGEQGSSLPVVGFMTLTAFSMVLSGASRTYTSHQRDNQDIAQFGRVVDDTSARTYCQYYVRCGTATAATNAVLLVGAAAYARGGMGSNALLGLSVVSKSVEACLKGIELGYWSCIKSHLGDTTSQRYQRDLNRTIVGIETVTQATVFNLATMGTYMTLNALTDHGEMWRGVILSLLVGCSVIVASNIYFSHLGQVIEECDSDASPA